MLHAQKWSASALICACIRRSSTLGQNHRHVSWQANEWRSEIKKREWEQQCIHQRHTWVIHTSELICTVSFTCNAACTATVRIDSDVCMHDSCRTCTSTLGQKQTRANSKLHMHCCMHSSCQNRLVAAACITSQWDMTSVKHTSHMSATSSALYCSLCRQSSEA